MWTHPRGERGCQSNATRVARARARRVTAPRIVDRAHIAPPRAARSSSAASKAGNPRGRNSSMRGRVPRRRAARAIARGRRHREMRHEVWRSGSGASETSRVVHRHTRLRILSVCPSFSCISPSTWRYSLQYTYTSSYTVRVSEFFHISPHPRGTIRAPTRIFLWTARARARGDAPRGSACVAMRAPRRSRVARERRTRGNTANQRASRAHLSMVLRQSAC